MASLIRAAPGKSSLLLLSRATGLASARAIFQTIDICEEGLDHDEPNAAHSPAIPEADGPHRGLEIICLAGEDEFV
jgi:hypothetical protein